MAKRNVFQFELDTDLSDAFLHAAKSARREPEELIAALVRDFVDQQSEEAGYADFVKRKVEAARKSVTVGQGRPSTEVDAVFEDIRKAVQKAGR
jgi:hypothetical protein